SFLCSTFSFSTSNSEKYKFYHLLAIYCSFTLHPIFLLLSIIAFCHSINLF
ncbi:hypothetical protein KSS87_007223, partial [Heliosperma pusillum]